MRIELAPVRLCTADQMVQRHVLAVAAGERRMPAGCGMHVAGTAAVAFLQSIFLRNAPIPHHTHIQEITRACTDRHNRTHS